MNTEIASPYLTAAEAAACLRTTVQGIYALVKRGRLKTDAWKGPIKREVTRVVTPAEAEATPVKQPRHFVMKNYEEMLKAEGLAFVSLADAKKTTPGVAQHSAGLDYIVLRGEEKLLITIRPNLPTKNANAAKEVQKLFGAAVPISQDLAERGRRGMEVARTHDAPYGGNQSRTWTSYTNCWRIE